MYFQKDTIMRMIEQLGAAYRRLMEMLDDIEAGDELDRSYRQLTGLNRASCSGLPVQALADMLPEDQRLAVAELTVLEADRFAHRLDIDEALALRCRALALLCTIQNDTIAELRAGYARKLFDSCNEALSSEAAEPLLRFLTLGSAYADAEDALFILLDDFGAPAELEKVLTAGRALYIDLLRLPDAALEKGGLPRAEALEGQSALERRAQAVKRA